MLIGNHDYKKAQRWLFPLERGKSVPYLRLLQISLRDEAAVAGVQFEKDPYTDGQMVSLFAFLCAFCLYLIVTGEGAGKNWGET